MLRGLGINKASRYTLVKSVWRSG
jgi:hypothetical protein